MQRAAALRNPELSHIGTCPAILRAGARREHPAQVVITALALPHQLPFHLRPNFHSLLRCIGERHVIEKFAGKFIAHRGATMVVGIHAKFLPALRLDGSRHGDDIVILHILRLRDCLAVDIDGVALDADTLAGKPDGAFHIILPAVHRPYHHLAEHLRMLCDIGARIAHSLAHELVDNHIIVRILNLQRHCVALRIIENHYVAALYLSHARKTVIVKLGIVDVAFAVEQGKRVLCKREMYRRLRHAGSINSLVHPKPVAYQKALFQRTRWNLILLTHEGEHEVNQHQRIDNGIYPGHQRPRESLFLLPPSPGHIIGDIDIGNQQPQKEQPRIPHQHHPENEDCRHQTESHPAGGLHPPEATQETIVGISVFLNGGNFIIVIFHFSQIESLPRSHGNPSCRRGIRRPPRHLRQNPHGSLRSA